VQQGGYDVITAEELKKLIDSGKDILIIDTMPYKAYKDMHVPGAKQFLFPIPNPKGTPFNEKEPSLARWNIFRKPTLLSLSKTCG